MTIITKWNSFRNWRYADVSKTPILDDASRWKTYVLSAPAWGLKGKFPGARHSWVAKKTVEGYWRTVEITDIETLQYQGSVPIYSKYWDPYVKQLIVSDRDPSTMWFGNEPRIDGVFDTTYIPWKFIEGYPFNNREINLFTNNCNTFVSYLACCNFWELELPYVGFKNKEYWKKVLD